MVIVIISILIMIIILLLWSMPSAMMFLTILPCVPGVPIAPRATPAGLSVVAISALTRTICHVPVVLSRMILFPKKICRILRKIQMIPMRCRLPRMSTIIMMLASCFHYFIKLQPIYIVMFVLCYFEMLRLRKFLMKA